MDSVTTVDILRSLHTQQVILKLDVEGFECQVTKVSHKTKFKFLTRNIMMSQALPENVLDGSLGIFIPYIFAEWTQIVINLAGNLY